MEDELTARLLATPALTALTGNQITWGERDKRQAIPAIVMLLVSPGRNYVHAGADATGNPRVQFDCYAATRLQARELARILRDTLETPATQGAVRFSVALLDAQRGPVAEDVGGGLKVYRYSLDFFVWFSPAA